MKERIIRSRIHTVCIAAFSLLASTPVFAAIPLITDDTGTQGKGKSQLELFGEYAYDKEDRVKEQSTEVSATLTYGVSDSLDLVLSIPYQHIRTDDQVSVMEANGISDITIETKWRFYEQGDWSFGLKPGFTLPTGDDNDGLGAGKATCHVLFVSTYNAGEERYASGGRRTESPEEKAVHHVEWALHFNAGYTRNENTAGERKDLWSLSAAGLLEFIEDYYVVADIGAVTNADKESDTTPAYLLAGFIYSPRENLDFGLGVKAGLTDSETDLAVRGGITYRF